MEIRSIFYIGIYSYMRKLFLILGIVLFATTSTFAGEVELPSDSLGVHPWDGNQNDNHVIISNASHWSMYLTAGFNVCDMDFTSEKKHGVWVPNVGLGGHYHWNNTWGIGAEYKFRNYRVTGSEIKEGDDYRDARVMLKGMSHQIGAYVSFDVFNAFRPQNVKKLFALDLLAGGGIAWYKNSIQYPNIKKDSWWQNLQSDFPYQQHTGTTQEASSMDKYKCTGFYMAGVSAEFNLNRSFQLGLRGVYNFTTADLVDARPRGNNNDAWFDCEVILRYKFEPRNKSNVRNFMVPTTADNWNRGEYYEDPEMGAAKREAYEAAHAPKRDTVIVVQRDTIFMQPQEPAQPKVRRNYVVYFENDKFDLDNVALSTISSAVNDMNQDKDMLAVIVGSCDNTGAVEYNKWLAVQRADNVTNTMVNDFSIDSTRIYRVGRGIMQDDREEGSFRINRRVEIQLVDTTGMSQARKTFHRFEAYRNVKKTAAYRIPGSAEGASSSKIMTDPEPEEEQQEVIPQGQDKYVVKAGDTLGKIAKTCYGNSNCWVFIFMANRDKLATPNALKDGIELAIPHLSEEQKSLSISTMRQMMQEWSK